MGTHQNPVQRAVVLGVAVVCAGLNGTFDALIGMAIHNSFPPSFLDSGLVWRSSPKRNMVIITFSLLFCPLCDMIQNKRIWQSNCNFSGKKPSPGGKVARRKPGRMRVSLAPIFVQWR